MDLLAAIMVTFGKPVAVSEGEAREMARLAEETPARDAVKDLGEWFMKGATWLWVALFLLGFVGGVFGLVSMVGCMVIGAVFTMEMVADFGTDRDFRAWARRNWRDLVCLVPVFRGLRLLRAVRRSRRLVKAVAVMDGVVETADIGSRVKQMVKAGR